MPYSDEEYEEFLTHSGVKGMHWGVRKDRSPEEQRLHDSRVKSAGVAALFGGATFVATLGNPVFAAAVAAGTYHVARRAAFPVSSISSSEKAAGKTIIESTSKH